MHKIIYIFSISKISIKILHLTSGVIEIKKSRNRKKTTLDRQEMNIIFTEKEPRHGIRRMTQTRQDESHIP